MIIGLQALNWGYDIQNKNTQQIVLLIVLNEEWEYTGFREETMLF